MILELRYGSIVCIKMEWKVGLYSSISVDRNKYFFYGLTLNLTIHRVKRILISERIILIRKS